MRPWWEQYPDRWQREQHALDDVGWRWEVDESLTDHGIIGLRVAYPLPEPFAGLLTDADSTDARVADVTVALRIQYPAAYPFFPPSITDVDGRLRLPRHREPTAGTLCLIHARDWGVGTTAVELLQTQLPRMLAAATCAEPPEDDGLEMRAPEPVGHYTADRTGARILVDSGWQIPTDQQQGSLVVGFTRFSGQALGAGIVKLLHAGGRALETFPTRLCRQFPVTAVGRWVRWDDFNPQLTAGQVWELVEPNLAPLKLRISDTGEESDVRLAVEVIGLLVPSEVRYREAGEEWFFAIRSRPEQPDQGEAEVKYELFHSCFAGPGDLAVRTSATSGMSDRTVLLVGTGALGSTIATELARAGPRRLDLVDGDVCDPATSVRQTAPAIFAGYAKASVLGHLLTETNPYVDTHSHIVTVGAVHIPTDGQPNPHAALAHLIGTADLVIDAAADPAVTRYLAALASAREKPFLHASATAGGYGGLVAAFPPGRPGCWWCMLYHRRDGTLPFPPAAPNGTGTVVPIGCTERTFTGTSADLATIATHAARVAIDRLTRTHGPGGMRGDLHVAALRDHHGKPIPVRWRTRPIPLHQDCPMHTAHGTNPPRGNASVAAKRAVVAPTQTQPTMTTADRANSGPKPHPARTLKTRQRTTRTPAGSASRGGARTEPGPTGGEPPWPPETAPTPAQEPQTRP